MKYILSLVAATEIRHAKAQLAEEAGCTFSEVQEQATKCRDNGLIVTLTARNEVETCYVHPNLWKPA